MLEMRGYVTSWHTFRVLRVALCEFLALKPYSFGPWIGNRLHIIRAVSTRYGQDSDLVLVLP